MIYRVRARIRNERLHEFFKKLTDGTILNQKPDGEEIVDSMKRARFTSEDTIEWYETCYCPTPLAHERATVYDHYLDRMETEEAGEYGEMDGESFWDFMKDENHNGRT